jgi:nitroreductase
MGLRVKVDGNGAAGMKVSEAVNQRISVRAFRPDAPPRTLVEDILRRAARAPSGGNLQPWRVHVLAGEPLAALLTDVAGILADPSRRETPEYDVYSKELWDPLRARRFQAGEDLYAALGVPREDRAGRLAQFANNFRLFGAPVGLFFTLDRRVGPPQWSDLGMLMQTVMLLAVEAGLDTCAQEAWSQFPQTLARHLELGEQEMLFSGMALGYRDSNHPINSLRTRREALEDFAVIRGFSEG